jgi:hypothetical protein
MERRETIQVKSGVEYDPLFPRAMLTTIVKKEGATVADTIKFIPKVVDDTLFHTSRIAKVLKGRTVYETCRNIWQFVYDHIAYKKDEHGKEQVRSPARTWHDRTNNAGVDCDCYTVFISSILSNLKIRHKLRITKYSEDHFQHIYPIVPLSNGSYITIDCVVRAFNYEEPYSEKKDTNMDLEYLNGVSVSDRDYYKASDDEFDDKGAMRELNRILQRNASMGELGKIKFKDVLKKGLHLTNIINPATATIRAGLLLSAKTNIGKIGERLKWAYLTDAEAQAKGIDMKRFAKLKKIKDKLEKMFYGMGGQPSNLKKAILKGHGNRHHEVSGLGYLPDDMSGINEYSTTQDILGIEMYNEELSGVEQANDGLGIVAATAIASASGVVGVIIGLIKSVGSIFPKKAASGNSGGGGGGSSSGDGTDTSGNSNGDMSPASDDVKTPAAQISPPPSDAGTNGANNKVALQQSNAAPSTTTTPPADDDGADDTPPASNAKSFKKTNAAAKDTSTKPDGKSKVFWDNNKKWIKPTAIGAAGLVAVFAGLHFYHKSKASETSAPKKLVPAPSMAGLPKNNKKKKGGKKAKGKRSNKKTAVAWL